MDFSSIFEWEARLGEFGEALITEVAALPDGGAAILIFSHGQSQSKSISLGGESIGATEDGDQALVVRLDAGGAVAWVRQIHSEGVSESFSRLATDTAGATYVAGHFRSDTLDVAGTPLERHTTSGTAAAFAAKFDLEGTVVWATSIGEYGDDVIQNAALAVTPDGQTVMTLQYESQLHVGADLYAGVGSAVIVALDSSGAPRWSEALPWEAGLPFGLAASGQGTVRVSGDATASFSWGALDWSLDPALGRQVYQLELSSAAGDIVGATPLPSPPMAVATFFRAASPRHVVGTTRQALGEGFLARFGDKGVEWVVETRREVEFLAEDRESRALSMGYPDWDHCGVDGRPQIARRNLEGKEDLRVVVDRAFMDRVGLSVAPDGGLILGFVDGVVRTSALPEDP